MLLAAWCGLRRGEVLGLRREDVDLAVGVVTVARPRRTGTCSPSEPPLIGKSRTPRRGLATWPTSMGSAVQSAGWGILRADETLDYLLHQRSALARVLIDPGAAGTVAYRSFQVAF